MYAPPATPPPIAPSAGAVGGCHSERSEESAFVPDPVNVFAKQRLDHSPAHGPARRLLLHVIAGSDVLVLCPYLLQELQRILAYPQLLKRSVLTPHDIVEYVEYLARASILVAPAPVPERVLRDQADEPVPGTAVAGRADVICTRDADFFAEKVMRFSAAQGIRILTDVELLRSLF